MNTGESSGRSKFNNSQSGNKYFSEENVLTRIERGREMFLEFAERGVRHAPFLCRAFIALEQSLSFAFQLDWGRMGPYMQLAGEELQMADAFAPLKIADECGGEETVDLLKQVTRRLYAAYSSMQRFVDSRDRTFLFDTRQQLESVLFDLVLNKKRVAA